MRGQEEIGVHRVNPQYKDIKVGSYTSNNKGSDLFFFPFEEISQKIRQQGMREKVHYIILPFSSMSNLSGEADSLSNKSFMTILFVSQSIHRLQF